MLTTFRVAKPTRRSAATASAERNAHPRPRRRAATARRATIAAYADTEEGTITDLWTVGRMISINLGAARTVGLVYSISKSDLTWSEGAQNAIEVSIELVGEVRDRDERQLPVFDRGITVYPHIGADRAPHPRPRPAGRLRSRRSPFDHHRPAVAGRDHRRAHRHRRHADAAFRRCRHDRRRQVDRRLAAAAQGDRGAARPARPDPRSAQRIRRRAFPNTACASTPTRSTCRSGCSASRNSPRCCSAAARRCRRKLDVLRDLIPVAKSLYRNPAGGAVLRRGTDALTADTPVPYRMADLIKLIDERMGLLESKNDRPILQVAAARASSRPSPIRATSFMFNSRTDRGHDPRDDRQHLPRAARRHARSTCFEMAGMPSEVVNSVCSVLARLAFDLALWSEGKLRLLVLCEEAHRYMPADPRLGFCADPARAVAHRQGRPQIRLLPRRRHAAPGRTRPDHPVAVLDLLRHAALQRAATRRSSARPSPTRRPRRLSFLSSMGQREAIAFGEGVATTMRLKFERLDPMPHPRHRQAARGRRRRRATATTSTWSASSSGCATCRSRRAASPSPSRSAPQLQPGDPGYRKERTGLRAKPARRDQDDLDFGYGLKPEPVRLALVACSARPRPAFAPAECRRDAAISGIRALRADAVTAESSWPRRAAGRRGGRTSRRSPCRPRPQGRRWR